MKLQRITPNFNLSKKNQRLLGEDYTLFLQKITLDLTELNDLIIQYNETTSITLLSAIEEKQQAIAWNYPRKLTQYFPNYLKALFYTLSAELIQTHHYASPCLLESKPEDSLCYLLKTLSPIKFSRLLTLLYEEPLNKKIQQALVTLNLGTYWQSFLKTYHVQCLSDKNARIFKVSHIQDGTACVLRCQKPYGSTSQAIEYQIKQLLGDKIPYFASIYAEREGLLKKGGSRSLQIMPYYSSGDISEHAQWLSEHVKTTEEWLFFVITIHIQMLEFFIAYQQAGFFLPDAKLENFLVDQSSNGLEYTLKLIDLKSTRPIHADGLFYDPELQNDWNDSLLHTKGTTPTEVMRETCCSPEKANICMLGLNLYSALTQSKNKYRNRPYQVKPITHLDLKKLPSIPAAIEEPLKQLLIDTTQKHPNDRPSYETTMHQLTQFKATLPAFFKQQSPPADFLINLWQAMSSNPS